ncbi:hypothetical protein HGM15179_015084 [Zosterops borbonicus]|uniref:ribonuclease H n=1 Tax=Zosterops borbonicus TaxID=364589 RepID=A0A8K1G535_9PASS|nr:hypothetical protein HGM15179_015084 [Zosterops borbonicus]
MRNSPTLCQLFVTAALQPIRQAWPNVIIYNYIDDILLAQAEPFTAAQMKYVKDILAKQGLQIAPEKVQLQAPWKYLGWKITDSTITPQKLTLQTELHTLNDAQKFLGDLQWLKPVVGIPNELLMELRPMLRGTDPTAKIVSTLRQRTVLQKIAEIIQQGSTSCRDPLLPIDLAIWLRKHHLLGALVHQLKKRGENRRQEKDIQVLEWLQPSIQQCKTVFQKSEMLAVFIHKGRQRARQITGNEPGTILLPTAQDILQWYMENHEEVGLALLGGRATVVTTVKWPPPLRWVGEQQWLSKPLRSEQPIPEAITVFTDAGKKSQKAAITWQQGNEWREVILSAEEGDSLQTLELSAVEWVMTNLSEPVNIVTDSLYVAGIVQRIEGSEIRQVDNKRLGNLLIQLRLAIQTRTEHIPMQLFTFAVISGTLG